MATFYGLHLLVEPETSEETEEVHKLRQFEERAFTGF